MDEKQNIENENLTQENLQENDGLQTQNEQDEFLKLQEELNATKDSYLRAVADFENIKKRLEKDKANALAYAQEGFAKDLLPVIDAMIVATSFEAKDEYSKKILEGVENTLKLFENVLKKYGIAPIQSSGVFDPNLHEAMLSVESSEHKSGEIVQEFARGYTIKERVLRPSKVSVAK